MIAVRAAPSATRCLPSEGLDRDSGAARSQDMVAGAASRTPSRLLIRHLRQSQTLRRGARGHLPPLAQAADERLLAALDAYDAAAEAKSASTPAMVDAITEIVANPAHVGAVRGLQREKTTAGVGGSISL